MTMATPETSLVSDLEAVLDATRELWEDFRGETLFLTGGTGFFGSWLLESFLWANARLDLGAKALVLTRSPLRFAERVPHLAYDRAVELVEGDVRTFSRPPQRCRYVIHAAAETRTDAQADAIEVGREGTQRVLDWAYESRAEKVLLISSGAVYAEADGVRETAYPSSSPAPSPYGEGKRRAEDTCSKWALETGIEMKVARGFAFIGPYLPLDQSFAAGNFIADVLRGGPIQIRSNRPSYRSYMYTSDLAAWLWTILARGESGRPYNVGSIHRLTTVDLARQIAEIAGVEVNLPEGESESSSLAPTQYVPNIDRARNELGLTETVDLSEAIRRTLHWHHGQPPFNG